MAPEKIKHIYDRIFKRIMGLSQSSVINLINGIFETDYDPYTSSIEYLSTENVNDFLQLTVADVLIQVNHADIYHMEAQMNEDQNIVLRMFNYGYLTASRYRRSANELIFPEQKIIYLSADKNLAEEYHLIIRFGDQGTYTYKVDAYNYNEKSIEELNQKKLILLIPFQLLKLRKPLEKARTKENVALLKNLIRNDIIGSIEQNLKAGNITRDDTIKIVNLVHQLYTHIYSEYTELQAEGVADMFEEVFELEVDKILQERDAMLKAKDEALRSKDKQVEILRLLVKGKTSQQIAKELSIDIQEIESLCK